MSTPLRSRHHFAPLSLPRRCQHQLLQIQPPSAPLLPLLFSLDLSYRTWCWRDSGNNSRTEPTEPGQRMPWGKDWWDWTPVQWRGAPLTTAELSLGQLSWAERRRQNGWQSGSDLQDQCSGAGETAAQTPVQNWAQQSNGAAWLRGLICHSLSLFQAGRCGKCWPWKFPCHPAFVPDGHVGTEWEWSPYNLCLGKPSGQDLQGESTICLFLPNGEHLFAG